MITRRLLLQLSEAQSTGLWGLRSPPETAARWRCVLIRNHTDDYRWLKIGPKHNYVCLKSSVFGLFIGSWYMYVGSLCNIIPISAYPPCNAYHILSELSMWLECVELGRKRFGDLEQHGWTPVHCLWTLAFPAT